MLPWHQPLLVSTHPAHQKGRGWNLTVFICDSYIYLTIVLVLLCQPVACSWYALWGISPEALRLRLGPYVRTSPEALVLEAGSGVMSVVCTDISPEAWGWVWRDVRSVYGHLSGGWVRRDVRSVYGHLSGGLALELEAGSVCTDISPGLALEAGSVCTDISPEALWQLALEAGSVQGWLHMYGHVLVPLLPSWGMLYHENTWHICWYLKESLDYCYVCFSNLTLTLTNFQHRQHHTLIGLLLYVCFNNLTLTNYEHRQHHIMLSSATKILDPI